jgi:hypothetical protein
VVDISLLASSMNHELCLRGLSKIVISLFIGACWVVTVAGLIVDHAPHHQSHQHFPAEAINIDSINNEVISFPIHYINFAVKINQDDVKFGSNGNNFSSLRNVDDAPFVHFRLPRPIVVLNRRVVDLFISANGGIHLSKYVPCHPSFVFATPQCNLNNSYDGVIAPIMSDFDLTTRYCPHGYVSWFSTNEQITVAFRRMCYYGTSIDNTFRVTFFNDHRIEVAYDQFQKVKLFQQYLLPDRRFTISGLRPFIDDSNFITTLQDDYRGKSQWLTSLRGVYPMYDKAATGNKVLFCPISTDWCSLNNTIDFQTDTTSSFGYKPLAPEEMEIVLTTAILSCSNLTTFALVLSMDISMQSIGNNTIEFFCNTYFLKSNWFDNTDSTLLCAVNKTKLLDFLLERNTTNPFGNNIIYGKIAWLAQSSLDSNITLSLLPMDSISFPIKLNSTAIEASFATNIVSVVPSTCPNDFVCTHNYTCFDRSCYNISESDSIFSLASCANECVEDMSGSQNVSPHMVDSSGNCCAIDDMDCSGLCFGNNSLALNSQTSTVCCSWIYPIDCAGVCSGSKVVDACGVCGGQDTTGISCFNFSLFSITTKYKNMKDPLGIYPSFYLNQNRLSSEEVFVLDNASNSSFGASFSVIDDAALIDPVVTFSFSNITIPGGNKYRLNYSISIAGLASGEHPTWEIKTIRVTYYRSMFPSEIFVKDFHIYLTAYECSSVSNIDRCMNIPGCIFCMTYNNMFIVDNTKHYYFESSSGGRRLFNDFVPPKYASDSVTLTGLCIDGWVQEDCSVNMVANLELANAAFRMSPLTDIIIFVVSVMIVTMFCIV